MLPIQHKGIIMFLKSRFKNLFFAVVAIAALFGIASAAFIVFYPEKFSEISKDTTVYAANNANYKLPAPSEPRATTPDTAFLKSFSKVFANIAKEAKPALILIIAEKKVSVSQQPSIEDFFFPFMPPDFGGPGGPGGRAPRGRRGGGRQEVETAAGSGFIVDLKQGYAITNNHVIDGADKIVVSTVDGRKYKAKLVGTAKSLDIAVLKIEDLKKSTVKDLNLSNSDNAEVGDWVVALGAPFELPQTLTMGVVSAVKRSSDLLGIGGPNNFIQTDAPINPGNSGGPLLNLDGQVIGMTTAIFSKTGGSVGIGFAIPSNTIRLVADSIIANGKLTQSYLGVEMYDVSKFSPQALKDLKIDPNTDGGLVMRVLPGSPAAKAGLKAYDIIQSINGNRVKSLSEIQSQIMFLKPGSKAQIGVLRNRKDVTLEAVVTELPDKKGSKKDRDEEDDDSVAPEKGIAGDLGIYFAEKKSKSDHGVLIRSIIPGSMAEMAGLKRGDIILQVNKNNVSLPADVEAILSQADKEDKGAQVLLLVERDGNQSLVMLQIGS